MSKYYPSYEEVRYIVCNHQKWLSNFNYPSTNFRKITDGIRADFSSMDLTYEDFTDIDLRYAIFSKCILVGTNFRGAKLEGADFSDCELDFTRFGNNFNSNVWRGLTKYSLDDVIRNTHMEPRAYRDHMPQLNKNLDQKTENRITSDEFENELNKKLQGTYALPIPIKNDIKLTVYVVGIYSYLDCGLELIAAFCNGKDATQFLKQMQSKVDDKKIEFFCRPVSVF